MSKLIIMSGAPGSGKSTYAKQMIEKNPKTVIVSRDNIRFGLLQEGESYFSHENEVLKIFYTSIIHYLSSNYDVIADASHLS